MLIQREHIENLVANTQYWRPEDTTVTLCVITLDNGFTTHGYAACIDPDEFDEDMGREISRNRAIDEVFKFEAYIFAENRMNALIDEAGDSVGDVEEL